LVEFRVGRGHDGPARVGELLLSDRTFETPLLSSFEAKGSKFIASSTLGRDSTSKEPTLVSLPFISHIDELDLELLRPQDMYLLPSFPSIGSLSSEAPEVILDYQVQIATHLSSKIKSSQMILRVPPEISTESFSETARRLLESGISGAAFVFNGQLGPEDTGSFWLRSHLPLSMMAVALGRITPGMIPILHYYGFDIIDTNHGQEAATQNLRLWKTGPEKIETDKVPRYCSCPSCININDNENLLETLQNHNLETYRVALSESMHAMQRGQLRWLIESVTHNSTAIASLLRTLDKKLYSFIEEFTPSIGSNTLPLIGPESYNAPAVRRFREFVASRYSPPQGKQIVLLLPCSARKPYSDSKSHKIIAEVTNVILGSIQPRVAEAILTSPLGLVPRELERIYPAAQYDIPVTGDWDTEEIAIGAKALSTYLKKFEESAVVVAHVSGGYLDIVRAVEEDIEQSMIYTTHESRATSRESLENLQETLRELKEVLAIPTEPRTALRELVSATADYQFDTGAGPLLVPETAKLKGKPYRMILCHVDGEQVCSYIAESGTLSLTLEGGKRIASLGRYWVRLDVKNIKGGSIFAVGIQEADVDIRPGDEVIVINNDDEVIGVGRSEMSGREMCELTRGRAVTLRHKVG
jgi:archaeosine synthase